MILILAGLVVFVGISIFLWLLVAGQIEVGRTREKPNNYRALESSLL